MGALLIILGLVSTALLGASMPFIPGQFDPNTQPDQTFKQGDAACKPSLNSNRVVNVDVNSTLDGVYGSTAKFDWANKENKDWVLVKENAPIAAWKVLLEQHDIFTRGVYDPNLGEMEYVGSTIPGIGGNNPDSNSKEVYVGIGWCNPETGGHVVGGDDSRHCLDPLVQDTVFVLVNKGATLSDLPNSGQGCGDQTNGQFWLCSHDWGELKADDPPHTQENLAKYWWTFNIYYDASKLPANATYDDLPCWMKLQCPNGGDVDGAHRQDAHNNTPGCEVDNILDPITGQIAYSSNAQVAGIQEVHAQTTPQPPSPDLGAPRLIIKTSIPYMNITNPPSGVTIVENYISSQKMTTYDPGSDVEIGTAYNNHFKVYLRRGLVSGTSADHALILDPRPAHDGPYWMYVPILQDSKPGANTLQLGSFVPGIPSYFYEWWTPSCKPALYLYPEKEIALSVKVEPNGFITQSIPDHGTNGWEIVAQPDGTLFDSNDQLSPITNHYLYYEAAVKNVSIAKDTGWIKTVDQLPVFFADTLPRLGLNEQESKDFLDYWLPKLTQEGNKWYITLIDQDEVNRVEPVEFSVQPDNFYRVRFYFENVDHTYVSPFTIYRLPNTTYDRTGFTVIDWGGIMGNGSCGLEEVSK